MQGYKTLVAPQAVAIYNVVPDRSWLLRISPANLREASAQNARLNSRIRDLFKVSAIPEMNRHA